MGELKQTVLYDAHVAAGATLVDFGGWEMPIQYPHGILSEHLLCRSGCAIFDVSHMGRIEIGGKDRLAFLQHVLSSNAAALAVGQSQYCILPDIRGGAYDDAYLYRFEEETYLLVINAANIETDLSYLSLAAMRFDVTIENVSARYAAIAVQGPTSEAMLATLAGGAPLPQKKNALASLPMEGRPVRLSRTGYTGEPIGYELYCDSADARYFWDRLIALGANPTGLGARDTLRLEASLPLFGHEMGLGPHANRIPVFAVSLARFAVSFAEEKGDFVGKPALAAQAKAAAAYRAGDFSKTGDLPYRIFGIVLEGRGVLRSGFDIYQGEKSVGYVTSGTMVPYFLTPERPDLTKTAKRSIGFALLDCTICPNDTVEVDIRGKRVPARIVSRHIRQDLPPYVHPIVNNETI